VENQAEVGMETGGSHGQDRPLNDLDEWEDDLKRRYPEPASAFQPTDPNKKKEEFRDYRAEARPSVKEFYRLNHLHQTVEFVRGKHAEYLPLRRQRMGIWEAMEFLNTLVDDSDPDTNLPQIAHLMQTSEGIRRDGHPRWFILTGLLHDLGKVLCLWNEPQWAVVGDTFPVGCRFAPEIVFSEFFRDNPDSLDPRYTTPLGIYEAGCGLDNVLMSWGHDEYLYRVTKDYLPEPAQYMIRYHSCYPIHREGAYRELLTDHDRAMMAWVNEFNKYDLYTKNQEPPDVDGLRPYYEELINEFFPREIAW
jgi:inositol oxygenase